NRLVGDGPSPGPVDKSAATFGADTLGQDHVCRAVDAVRNDDVRDVYLRVAVHVRLDVSPGQAHKAALGQGQRRFGRWPRRNRPGRIWRPTGALRPVVLNWRTLSEGTHSVCST